MSRFFFKTCYYFFFIKSRCSVLHYIFKKNFTLQLKISSEKNEEILAWHKHKILYWKYMSSIPWFINYLYFWIYSSYNLHKKLEKILQEPDWPFVSFWNLKWLHFICSNSFLFVVPLPVIHCYSLSFVITRCLSLSFVTTRFITRCHSLSLIVIRCTTRCHSFSFAVIRCNTRCHSLSLIVTRCTTRLSFYKQSMIPIRKISSTSLKRTRLWERLSTIVAVKKNLNKSSFILCQRQVV